MVPKQSDSNSSSTSIARLRGHVVCVLRILFDRRAGGGDVEAENRPGSVGFEID